MATAFEVGYLTKRNGAQIAYGSVGTGSPLLLPPGWGAPLAWPGQRLETLAHHHTVLTYDMEGTGLSSGRVRFEDSYERHADELLEVVDHLAIAKAALLGESLGAPTAIDFTARYPDRVACVVTLGGYAKGPGTFNKKTTEAFPAVVRANWGLSSAALADMLWPNATADEREQLALAQRRAFDGETAARLLEEIYAVDLERRLSDVRAPTLVVHYRGDRAIPFRGGQAIAAGVAGATLLPLDGVAHLPTSAEDQAAYEAIARFVSSHPASLKADAASERSSMPAAELLTAREREVLELVASGLSNVAIATQFSISVRTVERHISNTYGKLGVRNRAQAATYALRSGLAT